MEPSNTKIKLFLELSRHCNHKCVFCGNKNQENHNFLNLENIKGLDEILKYAKSVDITGTGEVMLHPDFFHIIKVFTEKNIPIRIVTNGTLLNKVYQEAIVNSSVSEMVISVNSLNRETYKKLMGVDNLPIVLKNIDEFSKIFKKSFSFSFVMNSYNFNEIPDFIDFGKKYGKSIGCIGLTPTITYTPDLPIPDTEENRKKLENWKTYAINNKVTAWFFNFSTQVGSKEREIELSDKIKNCKWIYEKFFINIDGSVTPCCWSSLIMGNIFNNSFEEIWNGSIYKELRENVKNGNSKYCLKCRKEDS